MLSRLFRNLALYLFHIGFVRPVLLWVGGLRYRRRNLLPKGPCLVVSNHNSHLDAAVLMTLFPLRRLPRVNPVAAADYFGKTWLLRTTALLLMNGIPIERQPAKGEDPLQPLVAALQGGESLIFFPEGSRGEAGVVAPFRAGIGRLVLQLPGLLIVPVFLSGPERIWARGQLVPIPFNVDAIVGKPRSYPADMDAREIADQVRRDVLALAPPPPPAPGPRPAPPLRVAVCGVDDDDRRNLFQHVIKRLAAIDNTLGVTDPLIEADASGVREVNAPIPIAPGRPWLGLAAQMFRTGGLFKGERFVNMVDRARIDEALTHDSKRRFLVTDGSALVDLMAWAEADFYRGIFDATGMNRLMQYLSGQKTIPLGNWWSFIRKAPEVWLVNTFDLVRPPVPDVLVVIGTPARTMMERIRTRGEALQWYENEEFLGRLQQGYRQVGEVLDKRRKVIVLDVDLAEQGAERVADEVESACRKLIDLQATAT